MVSFQLGFIVPSLVLLSFPYSWLPTPPSAFQTQLQSHPLKVLDPHYNNPMSRQDRGMSLSPSLSLVTRQLL